MTPSVSRIAHLRLDLKGVEHPSGEVAEAHSYTQRPRPPPQKLTSLFGWKSASNRNGNGSPSRAFSDRSVSPIPSPSSPATPIMGAPPDRHNSLSLGLSQLSQSGPVSHRGVSDASSHSSTVPDMSGYAMELERELREVCVELAQSIRREMELEDEVERWKSEIPAVASEGNRRTSDYFSDSGISGVGSLRYPLQDGEMRLEELERSKRKAEQEKAELRMDMAQRMQKEAARGRQLEAQIRNLEDRLQSSSGRQSPSLAEGDRVRELEALLDGMRRRYQDERHLKENYEDLLSAMQQEIEEHRNERDMLKNKIVPQLRSRLEVLETEAKQSEHAVVENNRMREELQSQREEHQTLLRTRQTAYENVDFNEALPSTRGNGQELNAAENASYKRHKVQLTQSEERNPVLNTDMVRQQRSVEASAGLPCSPDLGTVSHPEPRSPRSEKDRIPGERPTPLDLRQPMSPPPIASIPEEDGISLVPPPSPKVGLSRSNSLARASFHKRSGSKPLTRSGSVKDRAISEVQEPMPERLKNVEEQRDALHGALKTLLQRYHYQGRQYTRRLKVMENERDFALNGTPRRATFAAEVQHLRSDVNYLRRRADDALEQKWQCEKGLGVVKMDLDRAQQETTSLRSLLQQRSILQPDDAAPNIKHASVSTPAVSLERTYIELQTTRALSLARIMDLEENVNGLRPMSAEAERTMELLKQSISDAQSERDNAQREAEDYRQQALALRRSELNHLGKESNLAAHLYASAQKMEELADSVQQEIESNALLRERLVDAANRGEQEQKNSAAKVVELQGKLKVLEDRATAAQAHSEEAVTRHEDELRRVQGSDNALLSRVRDATATLRTPSPRVATPNALFALRSPRLDKTTSGVGLSMAEASRTAALEKRVEELERALGDADEEMQEVVTRMNKAQMEVAELQTERDNAMARTRRLYMDIQTERGRVKALVS